MIKGILDPLIFIDPLSKIEGDQNLNLMEMEKEKTFWYEVESVERVEPVERWNGQQQTHTHGHNPTEIQTHSHDTQHSRALLLDNNGKTHDRMTYRLLFVRNLF